MYEDNFFRCGQFDGPQFCIKRLKWFKEERFFALAGNEFHKIGPRILKLFLPNLTLLNLLLSRFVSLFEVLFIGRLKVSLI